MLIISVTPEIQYEYKPAPAAVKNTIKAPEKRKVDENFTERSNGQTAIKRYGNLDLLRGHQKGITDYDSIRLKGCIQA